MSTTTISSSTPRTALASTIFVLPADDDRSDLDFCHVQGSSHFDITADRRRMASIIPRLADLRSGVRAGLRAPITRRPQLSNARFLTVKTPAAAPAPAPSAISDALATPGRQITTCPPPLDWPFEGPPSAEVEPLFATLVLRYDPLVEAIEAARARHGVPAFPHGRGHSPSSPCTEDVVMEDEISSTAAAADAAGMPLSMCGKRTSSDEHQLSPSKKTKKTAEDSEEEKYAEEEKEEDAVQQENDGDDGDNEDEEIPEADETDGDDEEEDEEEEEEEVDDAPILPIASDSPVFEEDEDEDEDEEDEEDGLSHIRRRYREELSALPTADYIVGVLGYPSGFLHNIELYLTKISKAIDSRRGRSPHRNIEWHIDALTKSTLWTEMVSHFVFVSTDKRMLDAELIHSFKMTSSTPEDFCASIIDYFYVEEVARFRKVQLVTAACLD